MPSGKVILEDDEYDEMMKEAHTLLNPKDYTTILYDKYRRPSTIMYYDDNLWNYSYTFNKFVMCMPRRSLMVDENIF